LIFSSRFSVSGSVGTRQLPPRRPLTREHICRPTRLSTGGAKKRSAYHTAVPGITRRFSGRPITVSVFFIAAVPGQQSPLGRYASSWSMRVQFLFGFPVCVHYSKLLVALAVIVRTGAITFRRTIDIQTARDRALELITPLPPWYHTVPTYSYHHNSQSNNHPPCLICAQPRVPFGLPYRQIIVCSVDQANFVFARFRTNINDT